MQKLDESDLRKLDILKNKSSLGWSDFGSRTVKQCQENVSFLGKSRRKLNVALLLKMSELVINL